MFCNFSAFAFTYVSQNSSETTRWLGHFVCLNPQIFSQIGILYADTLHDHIPINCENPIPCIKSETIMQDQHPEKWYIEWDNIHDDKKKTIYGDSLADFVNELLGHVLHNLPFCYDFSHHHQLDYINSASV